MGSEMCIRDSNNSDQRGRSNILSKPHSLSSIQLNNPTVASPTPVLISISVVRKIRLVLVCFHVLNPFLKRGLIDSIINARDKQITTQPSLCSGLRFSKKLITVSIVM